jgi:hypothetical protein
MLAYDAGGLRTDPIDEQKLFCTLPLPRYSPGSIPGTDIIFVHGDGLGFGVGGGGEGGLQPPIFRDIQSWQSKRRLIFLDGQNWFLSKDIWVRPMSSSATSTSGQSLSCPGR